MRNRTVCYEKKVSCRFSFRRNSRRKIQNEGTAATQVFNTISERTAGIVTPRKKGFRHHPKSKMFDYSVDPLGRAVIATAQSERGRRGPETKLFDEHQAPGKEERASLDAKRNAVPQRLIVLLLHSFVPLAKWSFANKKQETPWVPPKMTAFTNHLRYRGAMAFFAVQMPACSSKGKYYPRQQRSLDVALFQNRRKLSKILVALRRRRTACQVTAIAWIVRDLCLERKDLILHA